MASIGDTYTLSPNMVNQFVVGMHRSFSDLYYNHAFTFSDLGMNRPGTWMNNYPISDVANDGFERGHIFGVAFLEDEYNIADILSWTKGKHQFTFGGGFSYGQG